MKNNLDFVLTKGTSCMVKMQEGLNTENTSSAGKQGRVLLVEDSETSRQVAWHFLKKAGLLIEEAKNGKEAVEKFEDGIYDLILMDLQMPVMDGNTATQLIREKEKEDLRVPIVALSANALAIDKITSLEAGMDDFLEKPLKLNKLYEVIHKYIPEHELSSKEQETTPQEGANASNEIAPINYNQAVQTFSGDTELLETVIDQFLEKVESQIKEISQALSQGNKEIVRKTAHTIKGGASSLSATPLADRKSVV